MSPRQRSTRVPLADTVYATLFEELISGKRAPGETLNIATLGDELNVSQTPIREALARMENTGLVRRYALRGYEVTPLLNAQQIGELTEARLLLEPAFAAIAAGKTTPEFLDKLRHTIAEMESAEPDRGEYTLSGALTSDESFHLLISVQTENPYLERAYKSLRSHVQRFRLFSGTATEHAHAAAKEHHRIYDALAAGDPEAAAEGMRVHLRNAHARMMSDYASLTDEDAP